MKIKITESQYRKIITEVGGYDDENIMASHGGNIHGQLSRAISETIGVMAAFIGHLQDDKLSKNQIMTGVSNITNKFDDDVRLIKSLANEIFLDDDFKKLILNYMKATSKIIKYFRMLSGFSAGMLGGKPTNLSYGLGMGMTDSELRENIAEKLSSLGGYIESLGNMFTTIIGRYEGRLNRDN